MRSTIRTAVLGVTLVALVGCQPRWLRPPIEGTETDVVALADPGVLVVGATTYVAGTNRFPDNVPLLRSRPGTQDVNPIGDALPDPPPWAWSREEGGAFWAPSLALLDGRYVLYFSARHRDVSADDPGWCIGVAVSDTPEGPYTPTDAPVFCAALQGRSSGPLTRKPVAGRGAIDPQVYQRGSRAWLHFKALDHPWQLWAVELSADGLATTGPGRGLVEMHSQDAEWEYSARERFTILENPSMDHNPDGIEGARYYLYYSGDDWQSDDYATGVAACRTPIGPCLRATDPPWLRGRGVTGGPGGLTVVRDGTGQRWAIFHGWVETDDRRRVLHIEPLGYDGITPVLLSRAPDAIVAVTQPAGGDPSVVHVDGAAGDPDRPGAEVAYRVTVDGERVAQARTSSGLFHVELVGQFGPHTVCVDLRDDFRLGWTEVHCTEIDGGPPPAAVVPPTTTVPATSTTTASTPTAPSSTTMPPSAPTAAGPD